MDIEKFRKLSSKFDDTKLTLLYIWMELQEKDENGYFITDNETIANELKLSKEETIQCLARLFRKGLMDFESEEVEGKLVTKYKVLAIPKTTRAENKLGAKQTPHTSLPVSMLWILDNEMYKLLAYLVAFSNKNEWFDVTIKALGEVLRQNHREVTLAIEGLYRNGLVDVATYIKGRTKSNRYKINYEKIKELSLQTPFSFTQIEKPKRGEELTYLKK